MTDAYEYNNGNSINILLVEDSPGDVRLIKEVFQETDTETKFNIITDGDEAIDALTQPDAVNRTFHPDLALIDLNLPGKDGCDVLKAIRDNSQFHRLPVLMLTTSDNHKDIERCYEAHANAYLTKPTNPEEFISLAKTIEEFWFVEARLPSMS